MGKISDIWVRLGLKKDDFDKGMNDAAKKTEGVGSAFGKMKAGALAVWAAVGAAATKFAKDLISSTNRMSDAWTVFTSKATAAWDTFLSAVSSWDFSNLFARMEEAMTQAGEFAKALDMGFEVGNSIAMQRAAMAGELAALMITMQDATKPYDIRIKAAEDYLAKVKPLYDKIEAEAKRLEDAHFGKWLAGTGLGDTPQIRADLRKFLMEGLGDVSLIEALNAAMEHETELKAAQKLINQQRILGVWTEEMEAAIMAAVPAMPDFSRWQGGYNTSLVDFYRVYNNMRGDSATSQLVQAIVAAYNSAGLYEKETKEIQSVMNGLVNQRATAAVTEAAKNAPKDVSKNLQKDLNAFIKDMSLSLDKVEIGLEVDDAELAAVDELLNSITDEYFTAQNKIIDFNNAIAQSIEDTLITSMSNGLQAITDMMFGLEGANWQNALAAFIAPLGDTMKQMGAMIMAEGIAMKAFKESFETPAAAIAAGAALIAVGSVVSSGLQRLTANPGGGTGYSSGSSASAGVQNYESEMTIYVEGKISGSDIVLAGNKTLKNWRR